MALTELPVRHTYLAGRWMPRDKKVLAAFLNKVMVEARAKAEARLKAEEPEEVLEKELSPAFARLAEPSGAKLAFRRARQEVRNPVQVEALKPSVQRLKDLIESNPKAYMFFTQMFSQVPWWHRFTPDEEPQIRSWNVMIEMFDVLMTRAPEYNDSGLVGFPFNAILDWSMATVGGWAGFLDDDINTAIGNMLDEWGAFLSSPDSCSTLNDEPDGWFGADAQKAMPDFAEEFICDPKAEHYGFTSWDDFFTRRFRDGVRPVASPDDDNIIANACESAPYRISRNVQLREKFWLKGQPYALQFMLDNDPYSDLFVGGTVYQAFLSALSYHLWNAPVSGTVVKVRSVPGTYYSESRAMGEDDAGPNESQGYIAQLATRALIFIEADNPKIGLMCFMAIGMAEVSTCDVTVYEGQHVAKGQELGMFHFGGSTHCLIFRPEVNLEFCLDQEPGLDAKNINVKSHLATVV